jgi:hypothetical protein
MFNKKIIPFIALTLFLSAFLMPSFAENQKDDTVVDCVNVCPQRPYPIGNGFSRGIQQITFMNFAASKIAEGQIKKELLKLAKGDFDVDIDSYSALDLINGKLKGLEVNAKNIDFLDIYFSTVHAKSACDFISVDYLANPVKLREPLTVTFNSTISEKDLNNTLKGEKYKKQLLNIKTNANDFKLIDFLNPRATLKNNRVQIVTDIKMPVLFNVISFPLTVDSDFQVVNNKIKLSNANISTGNKKLGITFPQYFIDMINPLIIASAGLESNGKKLTLEKVSVQNNQIEIAGNLWLPKSN